MKTLVFLFCVLAASQCWAATYYVATTGNDSNAGTVGSPFLTVAKAASVAQPGDTVEIAAGTYTGSSNNLNTVRHGTSIAPITFRGAGPALTTIRYLQFYHDWIVVEDLKSNGSWSFYAGTNNCTVDNCITDLSLITNGNTSNIWMEGDAVTSTTANHTIKNCQLLNPKTQSGRVATMRGTGHLIENCYIAKTDNAPDCFWIWGTNHIIRGCTVESWDQVPYDSSIHLDIFQSFGNNSEISKNILIESNFFKGGINTQLANITDDKRNESISDWTFRNNIFANFTNCQAMIYAPRFKFYNNLFYKCFTMSGKYASPTFRTSTDRGSGHGGVMRNNIWYLCGQNTATTYHGFYDLMEDGGPLNDMDIDFNMVIGTGAGTQKNGKWTSYRGIARNTNGLNGVDPLFVNPINADSLDELRLQPGSPAIGAAQVLNELFTTDYTGVTRGLEWDMGPLEYDVGELPTDTTAPTLTSAAINSTGLQLTLTFSENAFNVNSAHYALTGGHSLGTANVVGPIVTIPISPAVQSGATVTLSYTSGAGRTADAAGNLLASFSITSGDPGFDNNSLEDTPDPPTPGRKGRGAARLLGK